ncbi:MAG: hypothetical protein KGV50_06715 [Gammaproteobacteria bacterium]|nr:hypothetical protein [Gammaproteobacteria bacterium]
MLGNEYLTIKETLDFLNKNTQSQVNFEYLSNLVLRKKLNALIQVDANFTLINNPREKPAKYRIIAYCSFDGKYIKDFNISAVGSYVQNEPIYRLADIPKEFIIYELFSINPKIDLKNGDTIYTPSNYFNKDRVTGRICITKAIYESYAVTKTNVRFHIDELKKLIGMIEESNNSKTELQQAQKEIKQLQSENQQLKAELAQVKEQLEQAQKENEQLKAEQSTNTLNQTELNKIHDTKYEYYAPDLSHAVNLWFSLYGENQKLDDSHTNKANHWINKNTKYADNATTSKDRIREIATPLKDFGVKRSKEN